jgi:hypothetical protein
MKLGSLFFCGFEPKVGILCIFIGMNENSEMIVGILCIFMGMNDNSEMIRGIPCIFTRMCMEKERLLDRVVTSMLYK